MVKYGIEKDGWRLSVADNSVDITPIPGRKEGLGTTIVQSLARQMGATTDIQTSPQGTTVSIHRGPRQACLL